MYRRRGGATTEEQDHVGLGRYCFHHQVAILLDSKSTMFKSRSLFELWSVGDRWNRPIGARNRTESFWRSNRQFSRTLIQWHLGFTWDKQLKSSGLASRRTFLRVKTQHGGYAVADFMWVLAWPNYEIQILQYVSLRPCCPFLNFLLTSSAS